MTSHKDCVSQIQPILFRKAQLLDGSIQDVRLENGWIVEKAASLTAKSGDLLIEAGGCLLLPGLQDHHLHLFATASARSSVQCGPPSVNNSFELKEALSTAAGSGWLRGVGFHDSVCEAINRDWLDDVCPDRPVRIQHRSGMMWIFNSCALEQLQCSEITDFPEGVERDGTGRLTGRFYNLDAWLGERMPRSWPSLEVLSKELAAFGITGVTDTGVNNNEEVWSALNSASERGELIQRALVMGSEAMNSLDQQKVKRLSVGPLKLYLREADLPDLEVFIQRITRAHEIGRAVAVHCVTRVEMIFLLEAFTQAGVLAGDRIEHASIADDDMVQRIAELGLIAVTQPHFIAERGDQYLTDVDADDVDWLYRGQGFLQQGVRLAAGSDAPYGSIDPWAAMQAAVSRQTRSGQVMSESERLTPFQALGLFGGTAHKPGDGMRVLEEGTIADVCLLNINLEQFCEKVPGNPVLLTICDGQMIYRKSSELPLNVEP